MLFGISMCFPVFWCAFRFFGAFWYLYGPGKVYPPWIWEFQTGPWSQPDPGIKLLNTAYPFLTLLNSHLSPIHLLILHKTVKIPDENGQYVFLSAKTEYWVHVFVLYTRQPLSGIYGSTYFRYFWRQTFSCFITLLKAVRRFNKWSKTKKIGFFDNTFSTCKIIWPY